MNEERENMIFSKFPGRFEHYLRGRHIECGPGWYHIIVDGITKAVALDPNINIIQIKEKFGTLRIYADSQVEGATDPLFEAERLSAKICDQCGVEADTTNRGGYSRTRCSRCDAIIRGANY